MFSLTPSSGISTRNPSLEATEKSFQELKGENSMNDSGDNLLFKIFPNPESTNTYLMAKIEDDMAISKKKNANSFERTSTDKLQEKRSTPCSPTRIVILKHASDRKEEKKAPWGSPSMEDFLIGGVLTAGVKVLVLKFTYKADPTQCTPDARHNATDDFDLDSKDDFDPNFKRLLEAVQKLKVSLDVSIFPHLLDSTKKEQHEQVVDFYITCETGSLPKIDLKGRGKDMGFAGHGLRKPSTELQETDMYRIISLLSIVGHSFMGKTTLLQQIYEDEMAVMDVLCSDEMALESFFQMEAMNKNLGELDDIEVLLKIITVEEDGVIWKALLYASCQIFDPGGLFLFATFIFLPMTCLDGVEFF